MILDTNAVSAMFAGDASIEPVLRESKKLHLPLIVSGEYRFGLMGSRKAAELEALLIILEQESRLLTIDIETTKSYAHIRHELKTAGTPIPENDV
jgi:predicted nucleic acid-binding protein